MESRAAFPKRLFAQSGLAIEFSEAIAAFRCIQFSQCMGEPMVQ